MNVIVSPSRLAWILTPHPAQVTFRERVEVAIEHGLDIAGLVLGAMILDKCVWMQVVSAHLAAEIGLDMLTLEPRVLLALAHQLAIKQPATQHTHGSLLV